MLHQKYGHVVFYVRMCTSLQLFFSQHQNTTRFNSMLDARGTNLFVEKLNQPRITQVLISFCTYTIFVTS